MPHFRNISYYDLAGRQEYVTSDRAHQLTADGSHEMRCVSCGKAKGEGRCLVTRNNHTMAVFAIEPPVDESDSQLKGRRDSDCSLTERDSKRVVGITEGNPGEPPILNLVRRARRRLHNWADGSTRNHSVTVVNRAALQNLRS